MILAHKQGWVFKKKGATTYKLVADDVEDLPYLKLDGEEYFKTAKAFETGLIQFAMAVFSPDFEKDSELYDAVIKNVNGKTTVQILEINNREV